MHRAGSFSPLIRLPIGSRQVGCTWCAGVDQRSLLILQMANAHTTPGAVVKRVITCNLHPEPEELSVDFSTGAVAKNRRPRILLQCLSGGGCAFVPPNGPRFLQEETDSVSRRATASTWDVRVTNTTGSTGVLVRAFTVTTTLPAPTADTFLTANGLPHANPDYPLLSSATPAQPTGTDTGDDQTEGSEAAGTETGGDQTEVAGENETESADRRRPIGTSRPWPRPTSTCVSGGSPPVAKGRLPRSTVCLPTGGGRNCPRNERPRQRDRGGTFHSLMLERIMRKTRDSMITRSSCCLTSQSENCKAPAWGCVAGGRHKASGSICGRNRAKCVLTSVFCNRSQSDVFWRRRAMAPAIHGCDQPVSMHQGPHSQSALEAQ